MEAKDCIFILDTIRRHGFTQAKVAEALGCTLQNLQYLTRTQGSNTSLGSLMRIAEVIGVKDLREFLTPPDKVMTTTCPKCGEEITVLLL